MVSTIAAEPGGRWVRDCPRTGVPDPPEALLEAGRPPSPPELPTGEVPARDNTGPLPLARLPALVSVRRQDSHEH